ncbi:MAG: hypothetical protein ACQEUZ_02030 [Pseudomonadota bacterium]
MAENDRRDEKPPELKLFGRRLGLPRNRIARMGLGLALVIGGLFGFLPVLAFWWIPLGLGVLAWDIPALDRARRRLAARWRLWRKRRRQRRRDR